MFDICKNVTGSKRKAIFMKKFLKNSIAFTLAETLIVMGVIGIVSALTLPNLNASTGEKEKIAKVKKIYQNLNDALGRAVAVYGPLDEWFTGDSTIALKNKRFGELITEFMKISKNCELGSNESCFKSNIGYISSSTQENPLGNYSNVYKFITADGTGILIAIEAFGQDRIYIDIDGPNKGQNKFGVDIFTFEIDRNENNIGTDNSGYSFSTLLTTGSGFGPTAWVINYDNMDYMKANSTGKCSNSNVTLNASANPPVISCK